MKTGFLVVILVLIASCITTYTLLTSLIPDLVIVSESSHVDSIDPVVSMPEEVKSSAMEPLRLFHVAVTASADPYSRWQCRIMYYWYKKIKAQPDGSAEIGGFTRVLHTGDPDRLMDEIPTFVVDPLPPGKDHVVPFAMNPARKSLGGSGGGKLSPFLLLLISIISCFATYNLLSPFLQSDTASVTGDLSTTDPIISMPEKLKGSDVAGQKRLFHVALTATDAPYSKWQCRIMHYWYKQMRDRKGSEMGGFTRVLHSGKPDNLMDEIPTFVVDPLPEGKDRGYIVLNRPWAFVQWLQKAKIEEDYILMAEPDHVYIKPLPNLSRGDNPAAFPFFYITPAQHEKIIRKFYPEEKGPVSNIDPIGNSPVIIKKSILEKIAPTWMNVSIKMKEDEETDKAFGWVLEMYAYAVASALHGVQHILRKDFMIQPPWDLKLGNSYIIHFTYGCDYNMKGELTYGKIGEWRFDKRSYLSGPPPKNLTLPPPGVPESVVTLVKMVNEATANIPGWDDGR